ncbi:MAG: hypothetical protein KKB31_06070 [Nanoarchaeota archaeon]|nr:hypothetical protein [Nanoarchaeota archaeon]
MNRMEFLEFLDERRNYHLDIIKKIHPLLIKAWNKENLRYNYYKSLTKRVLKEEFDI